MYRTYGSRAMQEQRSGVPRDVACMDVGKGRELVAEALQAMLVKKRLKQQSFIQAYKSIIVFAFFRVFCVFRGLYFSFCE